MTQKKTFILFFFGALFCLGMIAPQKEVEKTVRENLHEYEKRDFPPPPQHLKRQPGEPPPLTPHEEELRHSDW